MTDLDRQLDARDEGIIASLRRNSRTPLTELARTVGLSRSTTQERLRRLETSGVILGYTLRLRPRAEALRAWFTIELSPGMSCADVTPALLEHRGVLLCHALAGPIDLLVLVEASDADALSALREMIAKIAGIVSVQTSPVLADHLS
jgi:Lrp/AsnC family leucine-responsive transcriptional regulator